MTVAELTDALKAVCPIFGVDGRGVITFDPTATDQQIAAANAIVATAKLNGQPARLSFTPQQVGTWMTNNLNASQKNTAALVTVAWLIAKNPDLAALIANAVGVTIPYDQANPAG